MAQTDRHTHIQTDGHGDQVGENHLLSYFGPSDDEIYAVIKSAVQYWPKV